MNSPENRLLNAAANAFATAIAAGHSQLTAMFLANQILWEDDEPTRLAAK